MKCDKCGYDDNGTGDFAHACAPFNIGASMTKSATELLPCPFCGGEPILHEHAPHSHSLMWGGKPIMPDYPGSWTIECCDVGMIKDTREEVVAAWNRRSAAHGEQSKVPQFIVREAERAIHAATHPTGMHTNGPAIARMEASKLAALLRYAQAGQACSAEQSEREAFERAMNAKRFFPAELDFTRTKSPSGRDEYLNSHLQSNWEGWQSRAALASAPSVPEDFDALIKWLLGENGDFPCREDGEGAYWWRKELRERYQSICSQPAKEVQEDFFNEFTADADCHKCLNGKAPSRMIVCPECGNKRCPKASDHELACTGSNEPGQAGSIFAAAPSTEKKE